MKNGLIIDAFGTKRWYKNNLLHREDGPAYEGISGHKEWWVNGKKHREGGPAIEWTDGTDGTDGSKHWYINGKLHREDGPAVEHADGDKYWCYQGQHINCQSQEEFKRIINLLSFI